MINFSFVIRNPWYNKWSKTLFSCVYDTPFKHKFLEVECYKDGTVVTFMCNWAIRRDHAGLDIELGLFGYNFHANFYDNRHWNTKEGRWMIYNEEEGLH